MRLRSCIMPTLTLLLGSLLFTAGSAASPEHLADLDLPADSRVSWVAKGLVQNGLPVDILEFRTSRSTRYVISHFRELWASNANGAAPGSIETRIGKWSVISSLQHGINIVVQVSTRDSETPSAGVNPGSSGFISALTLARSDGRSPQWNTVAGDAAALPAGSTILSRTASHDGSVRALTLIASNQRSVAENARFFRTRLSAGGWRNTVRFSRNGVATLGYSKHQQYLGISISSAPGGESVVLMTRVTHD